MTGLLVFETLSGGNGFAARPGQRPDRRPSNCSTPVSLRVGQADPQADESLRRITVDRHAALLVEYQADSAAAVAELSAAAHPVLRSLPVTGPAESPPTHGRGRGCGTPARACTPPSPSARPSGTTALLEDIVVPVPALLETCEQLTGLFARHAYRRQRDLRARQGRQHPFHADRAARRRGTAGPLPRIHRGHGGSRAGTGRFAQGRARHRPDDGPLRPPAVRRRAVRGDAGDQAALRSPRTAQSRAC